MKSTSISVTLCCAREDVVYLQPLVAHLSKEGVSARLLEGIDEDPHRLGPAIDEERGACMFVACLGESLGAAEFRRVSGVYNARRGPKHYLSELFVEPDEILAMAQSIHTALARAHKATTSPRRRASQTKSSHRREVVELTSITAIGSDAAPNSRERTPKRGNERSDKPGHRPDPEPDSARSGAYALSGKQLYGRDKSPPSEAQRAATPERRQPKIDVIEGSPRPGTSSTRGRVADLDRGAKPELSPEPEASPEPAPPFDSQVQPIIVPSHSPNKWMPVVLFIILIAVAITAVLVYIQDQDTAQPSARRGPAATGVTESAPASAPAPEPAPAPAPDDTQRLATDTAEAPIDLDEVAIIREAIEDGEMRAVDLVVVAKPGPLMPWRDASTKCRSKSHQGVRGWRLPTLGELKTLREARMLERDRYWSSTLATQTGTGSDHVYVLDLDARTIDPVLKDAADVRLRCVRPLAAD